MIGDLEKTSMNFMVYAITAEFTLFGHIVLFLDVVYNIALKIPFV